MHIYKVTISKYVYIGSTKNKRKRKTDHLRLLKKNTHFNKFMQNVFNKHGEYNFEILLSCESIEEMKIKEPELIKQHKCQYGKLCMNVLDGYSGGSEWRNHKTKEELKIHDFNRTNLSPEKRKMRNQTHSQTIQNIPYEDRKDWYARAADTRLKNIKSRKNYNPISFEIILPSGEKTVENYDTETQFFDNTNLEETSLRELKNTGEKIIKRRLHWTRHRFPVGTILRLL